jgi:hypothetical protein
MHVKDKKDIRRQALQALMKKSLLKKKHSEDESEGEEKKDEPSKGKSVTVTVSY